MTSISKFLFGTSEPNDRLRYADGVHRKPIVVWNVTPKCNLNCRHCYAAGGDGSAVLSTDEAKRVIDDLADYGVPVLLFSGGEPFCREDIRELAEHAKAKGLRVTFSTNGTLIDDDAADWLRRLGTGYVGISIDGSEGVHDGFRRQMGAYRRSVDAIRRLVARGVKVGLRITITRENVASLPEVFDLMRRERIPRICLYHLVYTGRGREIADSDLSAAERKDALETIISETERCFAAGFRPEVLTVDNHCDGPYLLMREERLGGSRAAYMRKLLALNGGNASGSGIACISWDGMVYPDQFWRNRPVGNVRERRFSEIWESADSLLAQLRDRKRFLNGKCRSCRWLEVCNGNFRARAEAATDDIWGMDPACYLWN